jgi:ATP-binding cassette subfamily B protein
VLLGLLPRDSGEIRWNGENVENPATFMVPPRAAYTPQVPRLFSDTLRDNILMGLHEDYVNLPQALEHAILTRDIAELENGLLTEVGPRGVKLSGGQMQRTAAARMFVRDADLLIMDDLSSALDVDTERALWEGLDRLRIEDQGSGVRDQGLETSDKENEPIDNPQSAIRNPQSPVTFLAVSHRRAALMRADRIVVLKDGHLEGEGTLEELLRTNEEMRQLWSSDLKEEAEEEAGAL